MRAVCFIALMLFAVAAPAVASTTDPDTIIKKRYDVAAQPLASALDSYSQQAGVQIRIDVPLPSKVQSNPVSGLYSASDALRKLLNNTGLEAHFGGGGVTITRSADDATPVYNLQPVEVIGARKRGYSATHTVSATKTDTPLRDTPQSISVVMRDVIADQAMQTMADVTRFIPGVTMGQGEGHRDAPTIRGQSSTADFFVDGVRDDAQYFRDLYNVDRVEALKGSNAMIFGRGGGGGVINRVSKQASWAPVRSVTVEGGSFDHKRTSLDIGQGISDNIALRLNGMYEDSKNFRNESDMHRRALNPTATFAFGDNTVIRAGYEFFQDNRRVDRGIPSFNGAPSNAPITQFFGNPDSSHAHTRVHAATALFEHKAGIVTIRNNARFTDYDKFYQNSYAGTAVNTAGTQVNLSAYNNSTPRRNAFNQTDVIFGLKKHTVLTGVELGRQRSINVRNTGYYRGTATSFAVDFNAPTVDESITFKQSASDANNNTVATVAAAYLQDQFAISNKLQAIGGVRVDHFNVDFHNNRTGDDLSRTDKLISPRAGLVFKPVAPMSFYGSYSVSYLPSSGDQFSSLTATTQTLEPEQFTNMEIGGKWDIRSGMSMSVAAYRLDRTNTSAPDPNDATKIVQTGSQRTNGVELNVAGDISSQWHVVVGLAAQSAEITSTTSAAKAGQKTPLVPARTASLWNRYNITKMFGLGAGIIHQSGMYAAIDNTVKLPEFTRVDGALFVKLTSAINAQVNVENVFDTRYYATSHGNNNILPGASRTVRMSLTTRY